MRKLAFLFILAIAAEVGVSAQSCHWQDDGQTVICCTENGCSYCSVESGKVVCGDLSIMRRLKFEARLAMPKLDKALVPVKFVSQ